MDRNVIPRMVFLARTRESTHDNDKFQNIARYFWEQVLHSIVEISYMSRIILRSGIITEGLDEDINKRTLSAVAVT